MSSGEATKPLPRPALTLVALAAGLEALLILADGPLGLGQARRLAFAYGAFWPGLLRDWTPLYPGQTWAMFFTYAVLHGNFLHLVFNMLILVHLSRETSARVGPWGFLLFCAVSAAGGGAGYVVLSSNTQPMVGASGIVFGLFGATMFWEAQRRKADGLSLKPVLRLGLGLVLLNFVLWVLLQGMLAWHAHLGGFVAGLAAAWLATPSVHYRWRPPSNRHP